MRAGAGARADRDVPACGGEGALRTTAALAPLVWGEGVANVHKLKANAASLRLRIVESGGGREWAMGNRAVPSTLAQGSQNPEKLQPGFGHRKGIGALREKGRVVVGVVHRGRRESVAAEFGPPDTPRVQL